MHVMIKAAADNLARPPRALAYCSKFCRMDRLVIVVGDPLCIVRELGETSFEALIFAHLVGAVRGFHQFGIFARFGAILLSGEHGRAFL
jgi:hypothetical protein